MLLCVQLMRVEGGSSSGSGADVPVVPHGKGRKLMHNASSKVAVVVEKMLLPLLDAPMRSHVVFDAVSDQVEMDLMEELERQRPDVMADPGSFSGHLLTLFDRYQAYSKGYMPVSGANSAP